MAIALLEDIVLDTTIEDVGHEAQVLGEIRRLGHVLEARCTELGLGVAEQLAEGSRWPAGTYRWD
jgi:hypothetical protein